jgi:hypothetical protein
MKMRKTRRQRGGGGDGGLNIFSSLRSAASSLKATASKFLGGGANQPPPPNVSVSAQEERQAEADVNELSRILVGLGEKIQAKKAELDALVAQANAQPQNERAMLLRNAQRQRRRSVQLPTASPEDQARMAAETLQNSTVLTLQSYQDTFYTDTLRHLNKHLLPCVEKIELQSYS